MICTVDGRPYCLLLSDSLWYMPAVPCNYLGDRGPKSHGSGFKLNLKFRRYVVAEKYPFMYPLHILDKS